MNSQGQPWSRGVYPRTHNPGKPLRRTLHALAATDYKKRFHSHDKRIRSHVRILMGWGKGQARTTSIEAYSIAGTQTGFAPKHRTNDAMHPRPYCSSTLVLYGWRRCACGMSGCGGPVRGSQRKHRCNLHGLWHGPSPHIYGTGGRSGPPKSTPPRQETLSTKSSGTLTPHASLRSCVRRGPLNTLVAPACCLPCSVASDQHAAAAAWEPERQQQRAGQHNTQNKSHRLKPCLCWAVAVMPTASWQPAHSKQADQPSD